MQRDSSQAILTINNAESSDTGCYTVKLVNVHGSESMNSSVTVEGASYSWFSTHYATCLSLTLATDIFSLSL